MEQKQALMYGFGGQEALLCRVLEARGIVPVPVAPEDMGQQVGRLCGLAGYREKKRQPGALPQGQGLLVLHNVTREELEELLKAIRQAGVTVPSLKAMVTPTNLNWTLDVLFGELFREQEIMGELRKLGRLRRNVLPDPGNLPLMHALIQAQKCFGGGEEVTLEQVKKAIRDLEAVLKP